MSLVRRRGNYTMLKKHCLQESSGETSSNEEETSNLIGSSGAGELVGGSCLGVSGSGADRTVNSGSRAVDGVCHDWVSLNWMSLDWVCLNGLGRLALICHGLIDWMGFDGLGDSLVLGLCSLNWVFGLDRLCLVDWVSLSWLGDRDGFAFQVLELCFFIEQGTLTIWSPWSALHR